jgi:DNA-binding response OmpR family regulator
MTASPAPESPKVILIVEDQLLIAMSVQGALEDHGYRVLELAVRHQQALDLVLETRPDMALVNIDLAGDDDGAALAWDLKAMGIPVIFISGQVAAVHEAREAALGAMCKPYDAADMVRAVDYMFRHLAGDESRPPPLKLDLFDRDPLAPAA